VALCFHVIFKHLSWWNKTCHVISWLQQLVRSSSSSMSWVFWFSQNGWRQNLQIVFHMHVVPHLLEGSSHHWHEVLKHFNKLFPYVENNALICWLSHLSSKSILLTKKNLVVSNFFSSCCIYANETHNPPQSILSWATKVKIHGHQPLFWHSIANWMLNVPKMYWSQSIYYD
jgi:hypothetical protein